MSNSSYGTFFLSQIKLSNPCEKYGLNSNGNVKLTTCDNYLKIMSFQKNPSPKKTAGCGLFLLFQEEDGQFGEGVSYDDPQYELKHYSPP